MTATLAPSRLSPASKRNASLDTLRALAILMVVVCHGTLSWGTPNAVQFLGLSGVGVDLFFCLSGWLLGRLLCEEFQRTGTIDLRRFWFRRWMRTLPAYYAVLAFTVGQSLIQHKMPQSWQFLVFLQNYIGMPFFGVSWSLCVEEYFYLMVAPLLLLTLRRPTARIVLPVLLALPLVGRLSMTSVNQHFGWHWNLEMTHLRYDQCAAGVLLAAISVFAPRLWQTLVRGLVVLVPLGLLLAGMNFYWRIAGIRHDDWDPLVWTFVFSTLVVLANSSDFWRSRARIPGARYIADRAYAIYLLHVEGIAVLYRIFGMDHGYSRLPLPLFLAAILIIALVAAEALYRLVEKPLMDARERFAASRSLHAQAPAPVTLVAVPEPARGSELTTAL